MSRSFRLVSVVVVVALLSALVPGQTAHADSPTAASAAPVNELPETVHVEPEERPKLPDAAPAERPPEDSAQAEWLEALEAEQRKELADVRANETGLTTTSERLETVVEDLPVELHPELHQPVDPAAPTDPGTTEPEEGGSEEPPEKAPEETPEDAPGDSQDAPEPPETPVPTPEAPGDAATAALLTVPKVGAALVRPAALPAGEACFPGSNPAYNASIEVISVVSTVMHNRAGSLSVKVSNTAGTAWPSGTILSYRLYDQAQNEVGGYGTNTVIDGLAAYSWRTLTATVGPISPGTWYLAWDINVPGVGWLSERGVCPLSQIQVENQIPSLTLVTPRLVDTITTRTPFLTVTGSDVDAWPTPSQLRYQFKVCTNSALTVGCVYSGSITSGSWQVPSGSLHWAQSYYWDVTVTDGSASKSLREGLYDPTQLRFTVVVPLPDDWRRVGNGTGLSNVHGLVLPYGVFVHSARDAQLDTVNVPLFLERTFSSGALGTEGAMGKGWLTTFDASVVRQPGNGTILVTYPDGRQEQFGQVSGGWVGAAQLGVDNRLVVASNGTITVTQITGEVVSYDSDGKLTKIDYPGSGSWTLDYSGGLATSITQQPSGKKIELSWTRTGTTCGTSTRPSKPYLATASIARDGEEADAVWRYAYSCDRLYTVTDPMGGVTRYSAYGTGFSATSPQGRALPGMSAAGSWVAVGTDYQERKVTLTQPGSPNRIVRLLKKPSSGSSSFYTSVYNSYGGTTVLWCEDRYISGNTEQCYNYYDTYRYDSYDRLRTSTRQAEGSGQWSTPYRYWFYGADGRLQLYADENYNGLNFSYDGYGNLSASYTWRDPYTQVTSQSYYQDLSPDPSAPLTRVVGVHVSPEDTGVYLGEYADMFHYDAVGHLTARTGPATPGAFGGEDVSYTYTTGSEAAQLGNGSTIAGATMPSDLLRSEVTAAGTTTYSYDDHGQLTRIVAPLGHSTQRSYDDRGLLTRELISGSTWTETLYGYDALGRLTSERDACIWNEITGDENQQLIEYRWDKDGLLLEEKRRAVACGTTTDIDPSRSTTHSYTAQGQLEQTTGPTGATVVYTYTTADPTRLDRVQDERGRVTRFTYTNGRLRQVIASVGATGSGQEAWLAEYGYDKAGRITSELDALGRITYYDHTDDDLTYRATRPGLPKPGGGVRTAELWSRQFDGAGNVTRETIGGLRTTAYRYDSEGRRFETAIDPHGLNRRATELRNNAGHVMEHSLTDGTRTERTSYEVNARGAVTATHVWLDGQRAFTTHTLRDSAGRLTEVRDPRYGQPGSTSSDYRSYLYYDELGRLAGSYGPRTVVNTPSAPTATDATAYGAGTRTARLGYTGTGYNAFGDVTETADALWRVTSFEVDAAGRVTAEHLPTYTPPGGSPINPVIRYEYNAAGDVTKVTDERGGITNYEYDVVGNVTKMRGPDLGWGNRPVTSYSYDKVGQLTSETSPTGAVTAYSYDLLGNVVAVTEQERTPTGTLGYVTSYAYNDASELVSVTSPAGRTTSFERNGAGEVTAVWTPGRSQPDRFEYDLAGRVTLETDGALRKTEHVYDLAGRKTSTTRIGTDGTRLTTSYQHDSAGNVIAATNPRGVTTNYEYDSQNRIISVTQPLTANQSVTVEAGYDLVGNLVRTRNGEGVDTWTTYNAWDLPERVIEAATDAHPNLSDRMWVHSYDVAGRPVAETQPGGIRVTRSYDALGRLTAETGHQDHSGDPAEGSRWFDYDLEGRIIEAGHPEGSLGFEWSDRGNLARTTDPFGREMTFGYDSDGLVSDRVSNTGTEQFSYDTAGRLASSSGTAGGNLSWTYDTASGDATGYQTPTVKVANGYDPQGRVASITTTKRSTGVVLDGIAYQYDANGNATDTTLTGNPVAGGGVYAYDLADRLVSWEPKTGSGELGILYQRHFGWDKANNFSSQSINITNQFWDYDERGRPTELDYDPDYGDHTIQTVASDARGNITRIDTDQGAQHSTRELSYDALGQLISDGGREYDYDSLGRLTALDLDKFSFWHADLDIEPEFLPNAAMNGSESILRSPDGTALATSAEGTTQFLLKNAHGDVTGNVDQTGGTIAGRVQLDPFGDHHFNSNYAAGRSSLGFQGDWTNATTEASWQGARWYDPSLRTFLSRDSYTPAFTGSTSLNRYGYGNANPLTNIDPDGRWAMSLAPPITAPSGVDFDRAWNDIVRGLQREFVGDNNERAAAKIGGRVLSRLIPGLGWVLTAADLFIVSGVVVNAFTPVSAPRSPILRTPGASPTTSRGTSTTSQGAPSSQGPQRVAPPAPRPPDTTVHFERASAPIRVGVHPDSGRVTIPADEQGSTLEDCSLSATYTSCLAGFEGVTVRCASIDAKMRPCAAAEPVAGKPGSMGPSVNTESVNRTHPALPGPVPGVAGGGGGNKPPDLITTDVCEPDGTVPGENNALRDTKSGRFVENPNSSRANAPGTSGLHGNSRQSDRPAWLYHMVTKYGEHKKWGVTGDLLRRYSPSELGEDTLDPFGPGCRSEMLDLERWLVENDPGPDNREPWAGKGNGEW